MKKLLLSASLFIACLSQVHAQLSKVDDVKKQLETTNKDTIAWAHGGVFDLGFNEGFLHNWAAGGELASISVNSIFSGHLDRLHHKEVWSNNLDLTYGLTYAYSTGFLPHKTDDRIDFTSKYGKRIDTSNFYVTGLFNFKSQFTKGYDYTMPDWQHNPTSDFLSPAYLTLAVGGEYRKGSDISFFLSPIAARLTVASTKYTTLDSAGAFGIPYNKTSLFEFGAYFSGRYQVNLSKSVTFKTRLDLYSNYLAKDRKDPAGNVIKDNPGNVSVLFDNLLSWKISKAFNIIVGATFIYDNHIPYSKTYIDQTTGLVTLKDDPGRDIGWMQIKQVFSLGMEYKFN